MIPVRLSLDWTYRGLRTCVLENRLVRATVIADAGAKIHELIYKPADRDLLYHHPRVELRLPVFGANVDNWWTGGIDECIPTGLPCTVDGEELPYLGEVWSVPWTMHQEDAGRIRLESRGVITPFKLERWLELRPEEPFLRSRHRVTNVGLSRMSFLWGLHAGLPLTGGARVDVPARDAVLEDGVPIAHFGEPGARMPWPPTALLSLGERPSGTWSLHYATNLEGGWCAARAGDWNGGLGITFPEAIFRSVWVWCVDGGWRGIRCLVMEPWTGYPAGLDQAIAQGNATSLEPGESLSAELRFIAFEAQDPVTGFREDGQPMTARASA